ncbi:MAG: flavin reductase family protein [Halobacteria archaeon]|nr:flavin reductase family protein [Halobacteria archaeon]
MTQTVDPGMFRQVMGQFATGVTVVTYPSDPPHGMTVNAFSSVSLDPPLILICVDHDTKSYEMLSEGEVDGYCVNILTRDQQHLGEYFANMTELEESPFESEATRTEVTGSPIFEEALAYIDCTLHSDLKAGDHTIYVGKVESAETLKPGASPLTFYEGGWGTIQPD